MPKVVYLGPAGSFTEIAAKMRFQVQELEPQPTIRRVILAVEKGDADSGVVPLENLYNGEVRETLDTLVEQPNVKIVGELSLQVVHCLGALSTHKPIDLILSKDQALEQCSRYLDEHYPSATLVPVSSTSEAVRKVTAENLANAAAIASEQTIAKGGLELLAKDICPNNRTRFALISRSSCAQTDDDKTLIAIHPEGKDKPGVLSRCLNIFAALDINLEYVQSRPNRGNGYLFYLEFVGHQEDPKVKTALQALSVSLYSPTNQNALKVLGSYRNSHWKG